MRVATALLLSLALAAVDGSAEAQPARPRRPVAPVRPVSPKPKPRPKPPTTPKAAGVFTGNLGIGVAKRLIESSVPSDRQRGLERLGAVGTPGALELLAKALEPGGAAKTSQERLVAVRALAAHAKQADVRLALVRALAGVGALSAGHDPIEQWVRETAALALARSGEREAIDLLAKALRQEGPVADAAAVGLEAHPPAAIAPIVDARGTPTVALVRLLGRLGDQRAFHGLRRFVKRGSPEVRAQAAIALTRLGDFETVALAKHWHENESNEALRQAAAQILAMARDAAADEAIASLLAKPEQRAPALELALGAALPDLIPSLERQLASHPDDAGTILSAIGRAGGKRASELLARELAKPAHSASAAYALALSPGSAASDALEQALARGSGDGFRHALRAAALRRRALGDGVSGTSSAIEKLLASSAPADRAAGAWATAALDPKAARRLLESRDRAIVCAVARQAFSGELAEQAARRLASESDPLIKTALASALASPAAQSLVPTAVLLELLDEAAGAAPIAARALAARDTPELRPRIEPLMTNADALVRASSALGLADSREPSVVGLLERAYRFEADPAVRHAIIVALSRRSERTRLRTLALARELDADRRVREAARLAHAGHRLSQLAAGRGTFWLSLVPNDASESVVAHTAELATPSGVVLPLVPDPDGAVTLAGLPAGPVRLRLASGPDRDQASGENGGRDRAR